LIAATAVNVARSDPHLDAILAHVFRFRNDLSLRDKFTDPSATWSVQSGTV
jgi:hypothetical protein